MLLYVEICEKLLYFLCTSVICLCEWSLKALDLVLVGMRRWMHVKVVVCSWNCFRQTAITYCETFCWMQSLDIILQVVPSFPKNKVLRSKVCGLDLQPWCPDVCPSFVTETFWGKILDLDVTFESDICTQKPYFMQWQLTVVLCHQLQQLINTVLWFVIVVGSDLSNDALLDADSLFLSVLPSYQVSVVVKRSILLSFQLEW